MISQRDIAQLRRAQAQLERIHEARCQREGLGSEYADDSIAWPASRAGVEVSELLDGIEEVAGDDKRSRSLASGAL